MQLNVSSLMDLPIMHMSILNTDGNNYMLFETIDTDDTGDTARWRLVFSYDTGKVYSEDPSTMQAFSYWTV